MGHQDSNLFNVPWLAEAFPDLDFHWLSKDSDQGVFWSVVNLSQDWIQVRLKIGLSFRRTVRQNRFIVMT